MQPAERLPMSEWAEENYVLSSDTSEIAGPWSNDYTPYLVPIMDWIDNPYTRQVTVVACSQAGKSELTNIVIGFTCDQEPAPTLICMPREDDANRRLATRIRPMFKANPNLLRHLPGQRPEGLNIGKETVLDNMILYIAWSNSPAALADNPVAIVILDEVGKYPAASGKEADPISLAKKRQRTFRTRSKLLVMSTPVGEDDLLDAEFKKGSMCEWHIQCLVCEKWHKLDFFNIELDKDGQGKLLSAKEYQDGGHARYKCPNCGQTYDDYGKWDMVQAGRFVPDGAKVNAQGQITGARDTQHHSCRITALMLHPVFQTIDDLAADWAVANAAKHQGNILPLQDFWNSQLGRPWRQSERSTELTKLRPHLNTRLQLDMVPVGCKMITAGIDVQADHVWAVLMGWGYLSECWLIHAARLETGDTSKLENYSLVRKFAASRWPMLEGMRVNEQQQAEHVKVMRLAATAVDCGYNTDVVTDFVIQCTESNLLAVRGDDKVKSTIYRVFKHPDKKTVRYDLNVGLLKDRIYRLLYESTAPGPGFMHIPAELPEDYLKQLASEEKRVVRTSRYKTALRWVLKHGFKYNHIWDAIVYAAFAAEIMGARLIGPDDYKPVKKVGKKIKVTRKIRTRY